MNANTFLELRLAPIAAALLTVFGSAYAAEGDLRSRITPDSSIEVGAGYVDDDNGNFGKYNGLDKDGGNLLLDGDIKTRDELTGTWMRLRGRNLGLDNRELRWDFTRQGKFGYYFEYNEIPRFEPLTVTTPVVGIGGPVLTLGPTAGVVDMESKRKRFSLGFDKTLTSNWGFNVDFRNETKKGERIFGIGTGNTGEHYFTPEPLDSTIRMLEATARYTNAGFHLVGGYYGTQYRNDLKTLTENYGVAAALALNPIVLPPDSQSHQLYATGGYSFSPTTRGTFKVAYSEATQDDTYVEPTINGRTDLGAKVQTTLVQAGISARPMAKLSVTGKLRYEDRNDKTPVLRYFLGSGTTLGFTEPRSLTNTSGNLEGSYALPQGFRVIGALEYDKKERNTYQFRSVAHRDETEEMSYRAEVRRSMSETLMGGLSYTYSDRSGSAFYQSVTTAGAAIVDQITPLPLADRKRDKVRLSLTWIPVSPLSVQFYLDDITDRYDGHLIPSGRPGGARKNEQRVYSVDAAYQISTDWQVTAWYSFNDNKYNNITPLEAFNTTSTNEADSFGLGLRGKPNSRLEVGADYSYSDITDEWRQNPIGATAPIPAAVDLPIAVTRLTRLKLFGKYHLDKASGLRLDYIYDRYSSNDPTWTGWVRPTINGYREGTVISQPSPQKVNFVGVRYFYNFR
ncbi:MAG: MtrB/PioB family decaheme-associated outer membrane protein [Betaproteobacteria bacterium]|nr:MtrB/PioB family decaheme-associated outer membrane protein [Betaproteobacteria bacterium]